MTKWEDFWLYHGPGSWYRRLRYYLYVRRVTRAVRPGQIYEDCGYRLMFCLSNDEGDLTGVDIISGRVGCCAVGGCGAWVPEPEFVKNYILRGGLLESSKND